MDPLGRDENDEHILEDMIRGDDVATQFLIESGEGDESLNRGDSGPDAWEEAVLGDSDEGEADFFKQKTAYEILRSDWSSDVCSSYLTRSGIELRHRRRGSHPRGYVRHFHFYRVDPWFLQNAKVIFGAVSAVLLQNGTKRKGARCCARCF